MPKRQVDRLRFTIRDPKARADVEDNFRKTITQLLGGAAVLLGAAAAYYGTLQTLQVNKDQAQRSEQSARDLLISNQVSKGFEELGSDKVVVRLGGIYALEGVMNASEQYYKPVLEALSAFVRDDTRYKKGNLGPLATDIQAALTVIGRRKEILTGFTHAEPDLTDANIAKADLNHANLQGANLSGTDLNHSNLVGADLTVADLDNANLSGAFLGNNFKRHVTSKITFVLESNPANLTSAYLLNADLRGADLRSANMRSTVLTGANLTGADLSYANLTGAYLNRADLTDADLTHAIVSQTQLDKACGRKAKLNPGLALKPCQSAVGARVAAGRYGR